MHGAWKQSRAGWLAGNQRREISRRRSPRPDLVEGVKKPRWENSGSGVENMKEQLEGGETLEGKRRCQRWEKR